MKRRLIKRLPPLRLWWLNPAWLFALVMGGTLAAAAWQTDSAYRLYGAPKFIRTEHLLLGIVAIGAFIVGARLAKRTGKAPARAPNGLVPTIKTLFWVITGLAFFGYIVWLAVGLKNGFSLGTLREFLTTDDPLLSESIRKDIFINLKGITTCTQFGVAAVPLGLWLYFQGYRKVVPAIVLLVALATMRALVFSERLALVELVVPAFLILLRLAALQEPWLRPYKAALQWAPALGIVGLFLFFGTFEYFRSWRYYRDRFDSYAEFTTWRVVGYYTTAHNNSAMALTTQPRYPLPYATLRQLWSIPGLESTPLGYTKITGVDPAARHEAMLERYGTPELNNEGGLFQPALDYGLAGYVLFWFASGFVSGRAFRAFRAGTLLGVTFYPLVFLAILETPRLLYLCYTRSLPALVTLALIWWLMRRPALETSDAACESPCLAST